MIRHLAALGLAFLLLAPLAAHGAQLGSGSMSAAGDTLDSRWLPWLGCWDLQADAVDHRPVADPPRRTVCVSARPDDRGINLTTFVDGGVAQEETLLADGDRRPLQRHDCDGWQEAHWSRDGHRLLSSAELKCEQGENRSFAGVSFLAANDVWVDVEAVGFDEHRELVVRHYRPSTGAAAEELGIVRLPAAQALAVADARPRAAAPLDVGDVLEAAEKVPSEVVEAVVLESGATFQIDSGTLLALADAGISDGVIDVMLAVSFPDHFIVDRGEVDEETGDGHRRRHAGYAGHPYPRHGLYGPYPAYWFYDPFFTPFHFGAFSRFPGRVIRIRPAVPDTGSLLGGKVIRGRGYARVRTRVGDGSDGSLLQRLVDGATGSSRSSSAGSSAGGQSGGGDGDHGAAAASPRGFTGGSSGRKAVRRGSGENDGGG